MRPPSAAHMGRPLAGLYIDFSLVRTLGKMVHYALEALLLPIIAQSSMKRMQRIRLTMTVQDLGDS
jgi:hypothetical protein